MNLIVGLNVVDLNVVDLNGLILKKEPEEAESEIKVVVCVKGRVWSYLMTLSRLYGVNDERF